MKKQLCIIGLGLLLTSCQSKTPTAAEITIPPQFSDVSLFLTPIKANKDAPLNSRITGITVPHHLLATDVIAQTFALASKQDVERVILISPDHFYLGKKNVSIADANIGTVFGDVEKDSEAIEALKKNPDVGVETFFYREHGVGALFPFIKNYFSQAKIVVITLRIDTPQDQYDSIANSLRPIVNDKTMIIQSTDFSHYLTPQKAKARDEETLRMLAVSGLKEVEHAIQPEHFDCRACMYVQMKLQRDVFQASPTVVMNKNSQEYTSEAVEETTSYVTQLYSPDSLSFHVPNTHRYFFLQEILSWEGA